MSKCIIGDCLTVLPTLESESAQMCVTSPPYWGLRDYGHDGQLGLEPTPEEYVARMVDVFREVRRVLRDDGTLWLNLGDSYAASGNGGNPSGSVHTKQSTNAGSCNGAHVAKPRIATTGLKPKDLVGIPWRVAFALQADGWYLRQDIIWHKPNPMPESVLDRCTKAHEYIFMLSKSARYYYDNEAIKEPAIYFDDDRKGRASDEHKSAPDAMKNGIRAVYKDARSYDDKNTDKQRGHGRRHAGFNDRWDGMDKSEQCGAMRNKRSVWTVATKPYSGAHFATFPPELIEPCILAGSKSGAVVLDPFGGSGTTGQVCESLGRQWLLIELNAAYADLAKDRTAQTGIVFA